MDKSEVLFAGEVMLLAWNESHSKGKTITLLIGEDEDFEAFKRMTVRHGKVAGQRLGLAVTQIGDDEKPVEQNVERVKGGVLAMLAGQLCQEERFQDWLKGEFGVWWGDAERLHVSRSEIAAQVVRVICKVDSRSQLDHHTYNAELFHERIRRPYAATHPA